VYETTLTDHPEFGSVCSGGRYDDLASIFTGKAMPGVGISIGLTRLFSQCLEAGLVVPDRSSPTEVLLVAADAVAVPKLLALGADLRQTGLVAENYLETKKLAKQFDYADKLGIPYVLVMGEQELSKNIVQLKNMHTGENETLEVAKVGAILKAQLAG
jgi:histidyl-tRNA synthetase